MNSITFFLSFIPILALILLSINLIFAPHNPYQEKSSTFECGFHSFLGQNRTQFNISFFIFGLLFLAFDLELVIALPGLINISGISAYGLSIMLIFFAILTIGFAFELGKKALSIDSRQTENTLKSSLLFNNFLYNVMACIKISIGHYVCKFNFINLIIGFVILRTLTLSLAFIISYYMMSNANIFSVAHYIIIVLITYKAFITPWGNNNFLNFIVALILNCIIISIILCLVILIFTESNNDTLYSAISVSAYLAWNDIFGTEFVLIYGDSYPNNGGPSNGPGGPYGGPPGGPQGGPSWLGFHHNQPNNDNTGAETREPEIPKQLLKKPLKAKDYGKKYWGLRPGTNNDIRGYVEDCLDRKSLPFSSQLNNLRDGILVHYAHYSNEECLRNPGSDISILVQKLKSQGLKPFRGESFSFTPDKEQDLRLALRKLDMWSKMHDPSLPVRVVTVLIPPVADPVVRPITYPVVQPAADPVVPPVTYPVVQPAASKSADIRNLLN